MATRKMRKGGGSPSFCWHCHKQLQRAPGKGQGLFFYHLVRDRDRKDHRVHGDCLEDVLRENYGCEWVMP